MGSGLDWRVQRIGPEAFDSVAEVLAASFEQSWGQEAIRGALTGKGVWAALIRGDSGEPVAVLLARQVADLLEIDQVAVVPAHRRRGAATAMLEVVLEGARAEGIAEARLELASSNSEARGLYEELGFVVVGKRARYYPDGDDALLLTRVLVAQESGSRGEA